MNKDSHAIIGKDSHIKHGTCDTVGMKDNSRFQVVVASLLAVVLLEPLILKERVSESAPQDA